jgi:hypothetical protein
MEAEVYSHDLGPDNYQAKHVANVKWSDGKVKVGVGMGNALYQWMKASFDKAYKQENGSIIAADFDYKAMSEMSFEGAYLSKIVLPKFDGSSKESLYFDLEMSAEKVRWLKGTGQVISGKGGVVQKAFLASNFRFEMGGLPCQRISTIDSITWTCAVALDHIGIHREPTKHASKVTVSDFSVEGSMADFDAWQAKATEWFVNGKHLAADEMQGSITILGPDMKEEIGVVELKNCGFKKFSRAALEANSEKVARFKAEFYCEAIGLKLAKYDA